MLITKLENRSTKSVFFFLFSLRHKEFSYRDKNVKVDKKAIKYMKNNTCFCIRLRQANSF